MKLCSIYNTQDKEKKSVAYLIYYDKQDCFYIEINEDATFDNLPMMLALFLQKGVYSIDSLWSRKWVQSRIIPPDRQNLGQILKENNIPYYDEYLLLIKSRGICSHDDFAVEEMQQYRLEKTVVFNRQKKNIQDIIVGKENLIVFFRDGSARRCSYEQLTAKAEHRGYLAEHLAEYRIMPGGYEINWNDVVTIDVKRLRSVGEQVEIGLEYFEEFTKRNVINTAQVCEILECSRQNVDELTKRGKLKPVQSSAKNKMYLRADVERLRE